MLKRLYRTELHEAALNGRLLQLKRLILKGENVNQLTEEHHTPLHEACISGHAICAKVLLEAGANADIFNLNFQTPLHCACWFGYLNCCKVILQYKTLDIASYHDCAEVCIKRNHLNCLKELLKQDLKTNLPTIFPPLHYACTFGSLAAVKVLVLSGACLTYFCSHGITSALHNAANKNNIAVTMFLLSFGANPYFKDGNGKTARDLLKFDSDCYNLLLQAEKKPKSLKNVCRLTLYSHLNCCNDLIGAIASLKLPCSVTEYLAFEYN